MQQTSVGFRLSPQQKHLWLLQEGNTTYKSQCDILIEGNLDTQALTDVLQEVVDSHEVLRTRFELFSTLAIPVQVIADGSAIDCRVIDLCGLSFHQQETELERMKSEDVRLAFDLSHDSPVRFSLARLTSNSHVLLISMPAMCADSLTLRNLMRDISRRYVLRQQGEQSPEQPIQYVQFSEWQNDLLHSPDVEEGRNYWQAQAASGFSVPKLPLEKTDSTPAMFEPRSTGSKWELSAEIYAAIQRTGFSVEVFLLACWMLLLRRLTGEPDLAVHLLCEGRPFEQMREAFGLYARWPQINCRLEDYMSSSELFKKVEEQVENAREYEEFFGWEDQARDLESRLPSDYPVAFECEQAAEDILIGKLRFSLLKQYTCAERFKLRLLVLKRQQSVSFEIHYDPSVYDPSQIELIGNYMAATVSSAATDQTSRIGDLDVLGQQERDKMLAQWNQTKRQYPDTPLVHRLEALAESRADEPAVIYSRSQISFKDLNCRANKLAHWLINHGVGPESRVAIYLPRGIELIVSLWAVWKAGAAFAPVDSAQPKHRLALMLQDLRPAAIITDRHLLNNLSDVNAPIVDLDAESERIDQQSQSNPVCRLDPRNLAYLIFTSGSTGRPKAMMIEHRSVLNLIGALRERVYSAQDEWLRVSLNAPLSFDASIKQIVQTAVGHTLVIVPEEIRADGRQLLECVATENIDVLDTTPSQLRLIIEAEDALDMKHWPNQLLVGGEAIDERLWRQLQAGPKKICNLYGPTECTVDASEVQLSADQTEPTIGRPLGNVRLYVLDEKLRPVPVGVPAELFIGGAGVGRGYFDQAEMTAEKFLPDPFGGSGQRMYRTADLVRYLPDGKLQYVNRKDAQVKVRGNRVELGEIEAVLRQHPQVREAALVVRGEGEEARLVGYVVCKQVAAPIDDEYQLGNGMSIAQQNRDETEAVYEEIFTRGDYERCGVRIPSGETTVIDVGANIGLFTLFVSSRNQRAKIYAIEPIAELCEKLRSNVSRYAPGAQVRQIGLGNKRTVEEFSFYSRMSVFSAMSKYADAADEAETMRQVLTNELEEGRADAEELLQHSAELMKWRLEATKQQCEVKRLSEVMKEEAIERVGLLKIDVQRAEKEVLEGIDEQDWKKIEQIVVEVHDKEGASTQGNVEEIRKMLGERGFKVVVEQERRLRGTDRYNLYAVQNARAANVTDEAENVDEQRRLMPNGFKGATKGIAQSEGESTPAALRTYLQERLPEYMIPSAIVKLQRMPITRNGKTDRSALPAPEEIDQSLGLDYIAPRNVLELELVHIWEEVLGIHPISVRSSFFSLGGHSILAVRLVAQIRSRLGIQIPLTDLFAGPTIEKLSRILRNRAPSPSYSPPVKIQPKGTAAPFFCVHPGGGEVLCYFDLARYLGTDRPFYGLQARGYGDESPFETVEEMAACYIEAIRSIQPRGPYHIGGWSFGGLVAFEMAQQLHAIGEPAGLVALFDTQAEETERTDFDATNLIIQNVGEHIPISVEELRSKDVDDQLSHVINLLKQRNLLPPDFDFEEARRYVDVYHAHWNATKRYVPRVYPGKLTLFRARDRSEEFLRRYPDPSRGWDKLALNGVEIIPVPGSHDTMVKNPHAEVLAERLRACLQQPEAVAVSAL